jgi:hypothetical protein
MFVLVFTHCDDDVFTFRLENPACIKIEKSAYFFTIVNIMILKKKHSNLVLPILGAIHDKIRQQKLQIQPTKKEFVNIDKFKSIM